MDERSIGIWIGIGICLGLWFLWVLTLAVLTFHKKRLEKKLLGICNGSTLLMRTMINTQEHASKGTDLWGDVAAMEGVTVQLMGPNVAPDKTTGAAFLAVRGLEHLVYSTNVPPAVIDNLIQTAIEEALKRANARDHRAG